MSTVPETEEKDPKLITRSTIKSTYHLTERQIQSLPVERETVNPHFRCAAPMKLYRQDIIEAFVATEDFQKSLQKRSKLIESAKRVAESKRQLTKQMITDFAQNIKVKQIPFKALEYNTIQDKQAWYEHTGEAYDKGYNAREADEQTKARWMVNYVRHNLTEYENGCELLFRRVGKTEAYELLKETVLDKIQERYPQLADEVTRQKDILKLKEPRIFY